MQMISPRRIVIPNGNKTWKRLWSYSEIKTIHTKSNSTVNARITIAKLSLYMAYTKLNCSRDNIFVFQTLQQTATVNKTVHTWGENSVNEARQWMHTVILKHLRGATMKSPRRNLLATFSINTTVNFRMENVCGRQRRRDAKLHVITSVNF